MKYRPSSQGNISVMVTASLLVAGMGLVFVARQLPQIQAVESHSNEVVGYQAALGSVVSYALHTVKERWCVGSNFMQAPCSANPAAWASDPLNTQRLLISDSQIADPQFLRTVGVTPEAAPALQIGTESRPFSTVIQLNQITSKHPLYVAIEALRDQKLYSGIQIDIARVRNLHLPMGGNEIFLNFKASLLPSGGLSGSHCVKKSCKDGKSTCADNELVSDYSVSLFCRGSRLYADQVVGFFPRELDSLALVVARDLRLDRRGAESQIGDAQVPSLSSKADLPIGSPGLLFTSPVFVNGNVVLPGLKEEGGSGDYSATTFADRLVLGAGSVQIERGSVPVELSPISSGGLNDQLYSQVSPNIGGIYQGVIREGQRDRGLDFLFKLQPGIVPNNQLMAQCIERNRAETDLTFSSQSALAVRATGPTAPMNNGVFSYRLVLTKRNRFVDQMIQAAASAGGQPGIRAVSQTQTDGSKPVVRLKIEFPSGGVTAQAARDSVLSIVSNSENGRELAAIESRMEVRMNPVRIGGNIQPDQLDLIVSFLEAGRMVVAPRISVEAYELGANGVGGLRSVMPMISNLVSLEFKKGNGALIIPPSGVEAVQFVTANPSGSRVISQDLPSGTDSTALELSCTSVVSSNAFETDFAPYARSSWFFRPVMASELFQFNLGEFDKATPTDRFNQVRQASQDLLGVGRVTDSLVTSVVSLIVSRTAGRVGDIYVNYDQASGFLQRSSDLAGTLVMGGKDYQKEGLKEIIAKDKRSEWPVYTLVKDSASGSIAGVCRIQASANFVTGFYVCDKLVIEARNTRLRIIGTFIVGSTSIDPSAIRSGIVWSSIFNRDAVKELMEVGRLGAGTSCTGGVPSWQPASSEEEARRRLCDPLNLRTAEPFRWSTVDPDCALMSGASQTICKRMIKRYGVKVISSGGSL